MSLRRSTFTVTVGANGDGRSNLTLQVPSAPTRNALLTSVLIDVSAAVLKPTPSVCITSLDVATVATGDTTAETYSLGDQLFYVDMMLDTSTYPSRGGVYEYRLDSSTGRTNIRTRYTECLVTNGGVGDVYTVQMFYETPGDYRF